MPAKATPGRYARSNPYIDRQSLQHAANVWILKAANAPKLDDTSQKLQDRTAECIALLRRQHPNAPWLDRIEAQLRRDTNICVGARLEHQELG